MENRLYDYGILIKLTEDEMFDKSGHYAHDSIKVLYKDPSHEWKDPFVHGANTR